MKYRIRTLIGSAKSNTYRKVNDKTNSGAKYAKTQDKVVHAFRYQLKRNLAAILSGIIED